MNDIPYHNPSGAADPTAYAAMGKVQEQQDEADVRLIQMLSVVKPIINWAGFDLLNRIEVRDRKTKRIYR